MGALIPEDHTSRVDARLGAVDDPWTGWRDDEQARMGLLRLAAFLVNYEGLAAHPPTERELEMLRHFADGCVRKEVATRMGCSLETVKTNLLHVRAKLGANNMTHAVAIAIRRGLID